MFVRCFCFVLGAVSSRVSAHFVPIAPYCNEPYCKTPALYRLDVRTGAGALLIRSKPFSVLKARPPELKQGLTARAEDASVP